MCLSNVVVVQIVVSLVNGRPGSKNFSYSPVLRDFTKATNIRLHFLRTSTLLGHLISKAQRDPTVTRRVSHTKDTQFCSFHYSSDQFNSIYFKFTNPLRGNKECIISRAQTHNDMVSHRPVMFSLPSASLPNVTRCSPYQHLSADTNTLT